MPLFFRSPFRLLLLLSFFLLVCAAKLALLLGFSRFARYVVISRIQLLVKFTFSARARSLVRFGRRSAIVECECLQMSRQRSERKGKHAEMIFLFIAASRGSVEKRYNLIPPLIENRISLSSECDAFDLQIEIACIRSVWNCGALRKAKRRRAETREHKTRAFTTNDFPSRGDEIYLPKKKKNFLRTQCAHLHEALRPISPIPHSPCDNARAHAHERLRDEQPKRSPFQFISVISLHFQNTKLITFGIQFCDRKSSGAADRAKLAFHKRGMKGGRLMTFDEFRNWRSA